MSTYTNPSTNTYGGESSQFAKQQNVKDSSSLKEGQLQQDSFKEGHLRQNSFDGQKDLNLKQQQTMQGQQFQSQLVGAQPLTGQGIAGGAFNRESGVGVVNLKPICIEQEPVMYKPKALIIPQEPLMVQPEAISIPQPPIVIHPEPIVIPQPPLTFQPPAVAVARPAITVQPEPVVLNRPSYSVQPTIQFDLQGCNKFNQPDFKQHVHVKLDGQQALAQSQMQGQGAGQQQWSQGSSLQGQQSQVNPHIASAQQNLQGQSGLGLTQHATSTGARQGSTSPTGKYSSYGQNQEVRKL